PDPRAHRQWLAKQRYRGAHALELPSLNGISYPLTDMQNALEVLKMRCRAPGLSVRRKQIDRPRRLGSCTWPLLRIRKRTKYWLPNQSVSTEADREAAKSRS
ncbi:hypothetical protein, partial [Mesorhizobium sp. M0207]|uniref:hypothetical protein n=1 Tax=Mesorhizobium sp. M0207 TaxID=2956915 RepID=UPI0033372038